MFVCFFSFAVSLKMLGGGKEPGQEEHELVWLKVRKADKISRCPDCGQAFKLDQIKSEHQHAHH